MRILVADPMPKVRRALTVLLEEQSDWVVVGYAANSAELYTKMITLDPQVVLLDWDLPGLNQKEFVSNLTPGKSPMVIILNWRPEISKVSKELGLEYFTSKVDAPEHLLVMVRQCEERIYAAENALMKPTRKHPGRHARQINSIVDGRNP